jgi:hypothetical protein
MAARARRRLPHDEFSLVAAAARKKISVEDARNATTDRIGFADALTAMLDAA